MDLTNGDPIILIVVSCLRWAQCIIKNKFNVDQYLNLKTLVTEK
jgi:hypothetical protein